MGATVCDAVEAAEGLELTGRADPELGVELGDVLDDADVVVDFTIPDQALPNAHKCLHSGTSVVIGTTGFDLEKLRKCAADHWNGGEGGRAFVAPNFAIGAVLMMQAAQMIAPHMPEVEIIELHHDRKLDKPSGTAARTAELIAAAGGNVHEPIHSVRLPGPRRPPGGRLRRPGPDADAAPRLDRPQLVHARRRPRLPQGRLAARAAHGRARGAARGLSGLAATAASPTPPEIRRLLGYAALAFGVCW